MKKPAGGDRRALLARLQVQIGRVQDQLARSVDGLGEPAGDTVASVATWPTTTASPTPSATGEAGAVMQRLQRFQDKLAKRSKTAAAGPRPKDSGQGQEEEEPCSLHGLVRCKSCRRSQPALDCFDEPETSSSWLSHKFVDNLQE